MQPELVFLNKTMKLNISGQFIYKNNIKSSHFQVQKHIQTGKTKSNRHLQNNILKMLQTFVMQHSCRSKKLKNECKQQVQSGYI